MNGNLNYDHKYTHLHYSNQSLELVNSETGAHTQGELVGKGKIEVQKWE